MSSKTSYLIVRGSIYHFSIRTCEGRLLRRSLKTDSLSQAQSLTGVILNKLKQVHRSYDVVKMLVEYEISKLFETNKSALVKSMGVNNELASPAPSISPKKITPKFCDAVEKMIQDKSSPLHIGKKNKTINQKTKDELLKWLQGFFEKQFANRHIEDISHVELDDSFYLLTQYPQLKLSPYKHMTEEQRIECAHNQEVPEEHRQQSGMARAKTAIYKLFDYFYARNLIEENPVDKMRFKDFKTGKTKGAYSVEQVSTLIKYCTKEPLNHFTSSILIMAYSGLRNGEIVKLQRYNIIRHDNGFYYFDVHGTKTDNAERRVPLHPDLLMFGILEYFDNKTDSISSQALTQWYNRFTGNIGLEPFDVKGNILTFYSLRHSFATVLANSGASDIHIEALMGHAHKGTKRHYIGNLNLTYLSNSINSIEYTNKPNV